MNVTIDPAPYKDGINVITAVQFTNEERAIIQQRKLETTPIISGASTPATTTKQFITDRVFTFIAGTIFLGGLVVFMLTALARDTSIVATLAPLVMVVGVILVLIAAVGRFRNKYQDYFQDTNYTVKHLLTGPIRLYADNPSFAKLMDDEIKTNLQTLKRYIDDNREIKSKESFEI